MTYFIILGERERPKMLTPGGTVKPGTTAFGRGGPKLKVPIIMLLLEATNNNMNFREKLLKTKVFSWVNSDTNFPLGTGYWVGIEKWYFSTITRVASQNRSITGLQLLYLKSQ